MCVSVVVVVVVGGHEEICLSIKLQQQKPKPRKT